MINAYGDKLAVDGGYYDTTDSEHFTFYSIATRAHNTILVDGMGQAQHSPRADGKITGFTESADFGYVSGDASGEHLYNGLLTKFLRQIVFVKPDYVIVYDQLAADRPRNFDFLLHAHIDRPVPVAGKSFRIVRPRAELSGTVLLPEQVRIRSAQAEFPAPHNWNSPDLLVITQPEQLLSIHPASRVTQMEFLVSMHIARPGIPSAEWRKMECSDAVGAVTADALIAFSRKPGKPVRIGNLEFDGAAAAVRLEKGTALSGFCAGGKILRWKGKPVPVISALPVRQRDTTVDLAGKSIPAKRFTRILPGGRLIESVHATLQIPQDSMLEIMTERTNAERSIRMAGSRENVFETIPAGKSRAVCLAMAGKSLLDITSPGSMGRISLKPGSAAVKPAAAEPADYRPGKQDIMVEAETMRPLRTGPSAEARKGTSGGRITTAWRSGAGAEWIFHIPEDGNYILRLRMATGSDLNLRRLQIDELDPVYCSIAPTGGFGHAPSEWRYFRAAGPVFLQKGSHRLRITAIRGKGNLDCITLESDGNVPPGCRGG